MPVPHYCTVAQLSQSDCDTFLIGGTDCVEAFQNIKKDSDLVPRCLYPGDVLRMESTYIASTKVRTSIFSKPQKKDEHFLTCIDQNDREMLLPFASEGIFYVVRNKKKRVEVPVRQMKDIITSERLPCEVKLIYGRKPTTLCCFTGMMVLRNEYDESSVVASSILNLRNILLEIPTEISTKFTVAVNNHELLDNKGYKDAVRLCQEEVETYMRNIKVSRGQDVQDTADIPEKWQTNSYLVETQGSSTDQRHPHTVSQIKSPSMQPQRIPIVIQNSPPISSHLYARNQVNPRQGIPFLPVQRNPDPGSVPPSLPIRTQHSRSPIYSRRPPRPPPQSNKPVLSNRVVSAGIPVESVGQASNSSGQISREQQCDEVCLEPKPVQNTPPETLPKCVPSSSKQTLSIDTGYLTASAYLSLHNSDEYETMSSAEKRVNETSQVVPAFDSQGANNTITGTGSISYSKCNFGMDGRRRKVRENEDNVYENIKDRRNVDHEQRKLLFYANQNVFIADDDLEYEQLDKLALGDAANRSSSVDSDIVADGGDHISAEVAQMSVTEVHEKLTEVGIKRKTRDLLKKEKVDGRLLAAFDQDYMMTSFPFISKIELMKIGLFINGWKP